MQKIVHYAPRTENVSRRVLALGLSVARSPKSHEREWYNMRPW